MEDNNSFLAQINDLGEQDDIDLIKTYGIIIDIEEVEYKIFKLTLLIEEKIFSGIYITYNKRNAGLKKNDTILLYDIYLKKKKRKIYIYSYYDRRKKAKENIINNNIEQSIKYDLSPPFLIDTISKYSNIVYKSDIFIYKQKSNEYILIPILEEKEFIIKDNTNGKEFEKFILENKVKENSLIYIDNYILDKTISFNNFTLFNIVNLEYLDEYFRIKYNSKYKNKDMIFYQLNTNYNENFVLLKVIDIEEKYIIGIDYFLNIYKLLKSNEQIKNIQNIYTLIFVKYFSKSIEEPFYILTINDYSYIYIFENTFFE